MAQYLGSIMLFDVRQNATGTHLRRFGLQLSLFPPLHSVPLLLPTHSLTSKVFQTFTMPLRETIDAVVSSETLREHRLAFFALSVQVYLDTIALQRTVPREYLVSLLQPASKNALVVLTHTASHVNERCSIKSLSLRSTLTRMLGKRTKLVRLDTRLSLRPLGNLSWLAEHLRTKEYGCMLRLKFQIISPNRRIGEAINAIEFWYGPTALQKASLITP